MIFFFKRLFIYLLFLSNIFRHTVEMQEVCVDGVVPKCHSLWSHIGTRVGAINGCGFDLKV